MKSAWLILVAGLKLCWTAHINANWLLTAMFVKDRHCAEIIQLVELDLVSVADLVPKTKVLRKGYFYCKDVISRHEFAKISDDEKLYYSIINRVAVDNLIELLHDLSRMAGTAIEIQVQRTFLLACAAGNVSVIGQLVHMLPPETINLGFILACSRMQLPTLEFLVDQVTSDRIFLERSMKIACMLGSVPVVSLLLDHFELEDSEYLAAAAYGGSLELVQQLMLDKRFNSNDDIGEALRWAIKMNNIHIAEYILEKNSSFKHLALRQACKHNRADFVRALLERYQDLSLRVGFNAACMKGHLEIVKLLMEVGHIKMDSDTLYFAANSKNPDLLRWLLQQPDIDVNLKMDTMTLFAKLLDDNVTLEVLNLIMQHESFSIDTLFSTFYMEQAKQLLLLPVTHRLIFAFKGDVMMRALSCGATIKGLIPLFCHPSVSNAQISAAAHIFDVEDNPRVMDKLRIIMACKSGQLDRCIELCINGDIRALIEVGIQCAAANEQPLILAHLLKMYHHNTATGIRENSIMKLDHVVGICRCLGATTSLKIIWEWLGTPFPTIQDLLSRTRPFQVRVIKNQIDNLTMDQHLDVICKHFQSLMVSLGDRTNLILLAERYRDHFLVMISIYAACPVIPLEYSDEMLTTMLKYY